MNNFQMLKVQDIIIGERFRSDLGNMESLKASIREFGLIHPIGVNQDMILIFGYRRLFAYRELGIEQIPAMLFDVDEYHSLMMQAAENTWLNHS